MYNKSLQKLTAELIKDIQAHPRDMILINIAMRRAFLAGQIDGQNQILKTITKSARKVTK